MIFVNLGLARVLAVGDHVGVGKEGRVHGHVAVSQTDGPLEKKKEQRSTLFAVPQHKYSGH